MASRTPPGACLGSRAHASRRSSTVADPAFHDYVDPDQGQPDKYVDSKQRGGDPEHAQ